MSRSILPNWPRGRNEDDWAAVTTSNQFGAIGAYSDFCRNDIQMWKDYALRLQNRNRPSIGQDHDQIKRLILNSWNTEFLLEKTRDNFWGPGSGFVVQWAFPQAYYSSYNSTLASFLASGLKQSSHRAVRRKVAELAVLNALPAGLSVYADGGKKTCNVHGMTTSQKKYESYHIDYRDPESIKGHIIHYFKSTRSKHLDDKKPDLEIKTRDNKKLKEKLNEADWERVSDSLGKTSWLCLLFRKRIKSNYKDIDTFMSDDFNTKIVLGGLAKFTFVFNLANEINLARNLSTEILFKCLAETEYSGKKRLEFIRDELLIK